MPRIVKSLYVKVGEKKEIGQSIIVGQTNKDIEPMKSIEPEKEMVEEVSFEEIYREKMLEIDGIIKEKLAEAQREAQDIIAEAYETSKQIYKNAKQDGFEDGFLAGKKEGFQIGKSEADGLIRDALDIKNEMMKTKQKLIGKLEKESIEIVIDTVEKILNMKIEDSHDTIVGLVKSALDRCAYVESLTLRVSPDDYNHVVSAKEKILCLAENIDDIIIKQDGSLKKGSCILDTISGSVDSSIEVQFDQIKKLFYEILESE